MWKEHLGLSAMKRVAYSARAGRIPVDHIVSETGLIKQPCSRHKTMRDVRESADGKAARQCGGRRVAQDATEWRRMRPHGRNSLMMEGQI